MHGAAKGERGTVAAWIYGRISQHGEESSCNGNYLESIGIGVQ